MTWPRARPPQVHGRKLGLPLGLLQLRPPEPLAAAQLAAATAQAVAAGLLAEPPAPPPPPPPAGPLAPGPGAATPLRHPASEVGAGHPGGSPGRSRGCCSPRPRHCSTAASARPLRHCVVCRGRVQGMELFAAEAYPPERRAARLSWAVTNAFVEEPRARQALLEAPSAAGRLLAVLAAAREARKVLAALAAVRGLRG